jgi:Sugar kinases, ribokinase family
LVSAIGKNEKTSVIRATLKENNINTKFLLIKGNQNDQYLSIETKNGEIFGSINTSSTFLSAQNDVIKHFSQICKAHKNENSNAIFIFDGNCSRELLDYVKKEASEKIFTKYFIPANFSKLAEFKNDAIYFKGFNLFINLKEANILMYSKKLKNAIDASIAIFEKIQTETSLTIVTDGPNIACGVSNEGVAKVKPAVMRGTASRLGAGDAFFAYFLSHKEMNPAASFKKSLHAANRMTQIYLKDND